MEVEGKGRLLVDESTIGLLELWREKQDVPSGRKRKRRDGRVNPRNTIVLSGGKTMRDDKGNRKDGEATGPSMPNWPDAEFPWALTTRARLRAREREDAEKLRCIRHFLQSDSEDEVEEQESDREQDLNLVLRAARW